MGEFNGKPKKKRDWSNAMGKRGGTRAQSAGVEPLRSRRKQKKHNVELRRNGGWGKNTSVEDNNASRKKGWRKETVPIKRDNKVSKNPRHTTRKKVWDVGKNPMKRRIRAAGGGKRK